MMETILNIAQLLGITFVAVELLMIAGEARKYRAREKLQSTLDYLVTCVDQHTYFDQWIKELNQERINQPEMLAPDEYKTIRSYLVTVERLSVGVKKGLFDFDYILNSNSKSLRRNFIAVKPYIDKSRIDRGSTRVWESYEWLCHELEGASPENIIPDDWECVPQFHSSKRSGFW